MRIKGISIFIMFVLLGTGVVALCKLSAKHESVVEFAYWWGNVRLTENGDVVPDGMCLGNVPRVDVIVDQCIGFTRPDCFLSPNPTTTRRRTSATTCRRTTTA